jgi:hypothetical protein
MYKKVMLIGLLTISVSAMLVTEAKAYSFLGGSFCYNCNSYVNQWLLQGGGPSDSSISTDYDIIGALVCVNPGTNQRDVRQGAGGLASITLDSPPILSSGTVDGSGHTSVKQVIYSTVAEFVANGGTRDDFNALYGVSNADCKKNWLTYEFLILNVRINSQVLKQCLDPNNPTSETCTVDDAIILNCDSNRDPKKFGTQPFLYQCVEQ